MAKLKFGVGSAVVCTLILLLSWIAPSSALAIQGRDGSYHLDETGKIGGIFLRPGVRDEFKSSVEIAWSHTLDTLRGTQGGEAQRSQIISRYQDYAILTSTFDTCKSVGDFQFDIWIVEPVSDIRIYLPSNFTFGYISSGYGNATSSDKIYSIWTDITNDYSYISVETLAEDDPIAPGWDRIEIGHLPTAGVLIPSFEVSPGLYHVRLFQIRAPPTAGLYHFKVYVDGQTIGEGNFPITIVKSGLDPAYVTGLVKLRELKPSTLVSGRVVATGVTSLGRYAEALAYFGPEDLETSDDDTSSYRYWLFGLPAGTFELTASASGFMGASSRITVDPGQSLTLPDFELEKGIEIYVTVRSKDENGPIPWGNLWQLPYGTNDPYLPIDDNGPHRDILVRLLDQYGESVGYWASDDIEPPYGPPWSAAAVDGKRNYSPLVLKPSTVPSNSSYVMTLTDRRGLPAMRLDGHVPADIADFVDGITEGSYTIDIQVTGYVTRQSDDWQRSFTTTPSAKTYAVQVDLIRSGWVMASAVVPDDSSRPMSPSTVAVVAKSADNIERGLVAGTFPANAKEFTMVLEGFNGAYNSLRTSIDYQDYGLDPMQYTFELYMADVGTPYAGRPGVGWYITEDHDPELQISLGTGSFPAVFNLKPASIEVALRSIRIHDPAQLSPWTFPGTRIEVYLTDEEGNRTATLDPAIYGFVQDDGTIIGDPYDVDKSDVGFHGLLRVLFTGVDPGPFGALSGTYPTRVEEGKYFVNVATLGYVQRENSSTYIAAGVRNDVQVDLVQGAQIRIELEFRHAGEPTAFNGFVRVEVYNQDDELVGASIYAGGDPSPNVGYFPYDSSRDWKLVSGAAEGAGTGTEPQRAFLSRLYYGVPPVTWANWPTMTPSDANRLSMPSNATLAFDVFGFHSYYGGPDSRTHTLWANGWDTTNGAEQLDSGIRGSKDVLDLEGWGNFTVRVWAFDPYGPDGKFDSNGPDGIFGTADDYTSPDPMEGGLSDFRAYAQPDETTQLQAPWGASATVHITLDDLSSLLGTVSWVDIYEHQTGLAWAQVMDTSPGGPWASTTGGNYKLWLPNGSHELLVTTVGHEQLWQPLYFKISLPTGGSCTFRDVVLTATENEVPEFTDSAWLMVILLESLVVVLSTRPIGRS